MLAVDASGSVNEARFELQKQGYVAAFRNPALVNALRSGSSRGIGRAMARALAGAGCAVAIQDIDLEAAQAEADQINAAGGRAIALGGDIVDLNLPQRAVAEVVAKLGK